MEQCCPGEAALQSLPCFPTAFVFLPGKSHGQRSLGGAPFHGVAKSWTELSDFTSLSR